MPAASARTRLRRRQFLLRTALTLGALSIRMPLVRAASLKGTATIEIPPELRYVRVPLPDEANAYVDWRKAKTAWTPPEEPVKSILLKTWRVGAKPLSDDERHALSVWLKTNQGALRCAEESLHKSKAQWPAFDPLTMDPALTILVDLARARIAEAYQLAHDQDFAAAAESLVGTARLGQLAANGEGVLIDYLVAVRSRDLTEEAAQKLALESEAPEAALQQLLQGLPTLDGERETFVRTLRVEFTDCAAKSTDPLKFAQSWSETYQKDPGLLLFFLPNDLQRQRAWVVFLDPHLVAGHPDPLDWNHGLKDEIERFRRHLKNATSSWRDREPEPKKTEEQRIRAFLADAKPVLRAVAGEPLPLSKAAAERARRAYNRFKNPVGRLFATQPDSIGPSGNRPFRARTLREATRAILALQIFRQRQGALPARLTELVEEKLLDRLPLDAFNDEPLHYDRDRALLWSVGENGIDDGGKDPPGKIWSGKDAVWSLTPAAPR